MQKSSYRVVVYIIYRNDKLRVSRVVWFVFIAVKQHRLEKTRGMVYMKKIIEWADTCSVV